MIARFLKFRSYLTECPSCSFFKLLYIFAFIMIGQIRAERGSGSAAIRTWDARSATNPSCSFNENGSPFTCMEKSILCWISLSLCFTEERKFGMLFLVNYITLEGFDLWWIFCWFYKYMLVNIFFFFKWYVLPYWYILLKMIKYDSFSYFGGKTVWGMKPSCILLTEYTWQHLLHSRNNSLPK